jgi:phage terminase large subunit
VSFRQLSADLRRSRELLLPSAFQFLWQTPRFLVAYGGRASAKSWSIARVLLSLAYERKLRVLCCREIQSSVRESAYRLLADQVQMLQLEDHFDIRADSIFGRNGSEFIFEGLRYNISRLRSLEGVNICWVEEAQAVSERSWEDLIPTIRKRGSRFFISFNPMTPDDPVARRFVESGRTDVIAQKVSWRDNPYLSPEVEAERVWLERTDMDAYRHVWEGEPRTVSDALILKGKYQVEPFAVDPAWAGPYHGLDYGFSRDPSAAVRCYIDDSSRVLYIDREYWALGADIDALPGALEAAISGISRYVVYADSARPESTSYLARNGIAHARSAEKWPGSVDDGIAYLRSFARIVIAPSCRHLIDECGRYSFESDRLTGVPLPKPIDAHNHLIDALRYALSPLIRKVPTGGYFSRGALLAADAAGVPAPVEMPEGVERLFAFAAIVESEPDALGTIFFAVTGEPAAGAAPPPIVIVDWDLTELAQGTLDSWFPRVDARLKELVSLTGSRDASPPLLVEPSGLQAMLLEQGLMRRVGVMELADAELLEKEMVERVAAVGTALENGAVKLARPAFEKRTVFRAVARNHLVSAVAAFSLAGGEKPKIGALLAAFATGSLHVLSGNYWMNVWMTLGRSRPLEGASLAALWAAPHDDPRAARARPRERLCGEPPEIPAGVREIDPAELERVKQQLRSMR